MSKKQEAAPVAPTYTESSKEAVQAQLDALPLQKRIEAEAALGLGQFAGIGDVDRARQMQEFELASAPAYAQALLDLQNAYGKDFAQSSRDQLQVTDPEGFALRQQFGGRLLNGHGTMEDLSKGLPAVPDYEKVTGTPDYAQFRDTAGTSALRGLSEQDAYNQLASIGTMDPALQRSAEQAARARGSSTGNILGDSSALQESLAVQLQQQGLDQQRRGNAGAFLTSGQTTSDQALREAGFNNSTASQSFDDVMNSINQRNQTAQNTFANRSANVGSQQNARQQDLANVQSFLGLQPIVSQGAQLSGLQQGAAPFQVTNVQQGIGVDPNAGRNGASFASNIFGTQSSNYNAAQSKGSGIGSLVGGLAGSFLGPLGTAVGSKVGGMISK